VPGRIMLGADGKSNSSQDGMRNAFFLLLAISLIFTTATAQTADTGSEPSLQIEAGMHTSLVRQIALTGDEKTMVSAAYDKSIRIWDIPEGKLRRVLRTPVGAGYEGSLYGVDITRDGKFVAASGWTKENYVYIYDTVTGAIVKAFGPNGNAINKLRISPDGSKVAVVMGAGSGIRMWDIKTGKLILDETDVGGVDCYSVDFRVDGVLATGCYDGALRFYRVDGKPIAKIQARSGKLPYKIDFSPVDQRLAIGYNDTTAIDILSASTFDLLAAEPIWLASPSTSDLAVGDLGTVSWSKDGKSLYAGGTYRNENFWNTVFRFSGSSLADRQEVYLAAQSTLDMAPYGSSGIALNVAVPTLVLIKDDKVVMELNTPISLMGTLGNSAIKTDATGRKVEFAYDYTEKAIGLFDVDRLELTDSSGSDGALLPAKIDGLDIQGAINNLSPTINGKPAVFDNYEGSRSFAVSADSSSVVFGTIWYVRRYDRDANFLWRTAAPGNTNGVTIVDGDRLVVTTASDGTVRWYRASDGQLLMTLFVQAVDKRWVIWSPKGFYAASPGGEDLIGWTVNRENTVAPDYFSASRFRDRFYRPDIIQTILKTLDEDEAIKQADAASGNTSETTDGIRGILPPVVELAMDSDQIQTASSPVQVKYRVRSPSGEKVERIEVLIDGRPLEARGAISVPDNEDDVESLDIPIPQQNTEIGLIAYTNSGASEVTRVKVVWDGAAADMFKPKLYAVIIGVSAYDNKDLTLKYAAQDATDFAKALDAQKGGMYREVEARVITDAQATRGDIVEALEWLEGEVTARDVGLVFMAGHGMTDNKQRFYFLPADVDLDKLRSTAVSRDELLETMGGLAGKALMFIDACHSAASLEPGEQTRAGPTDITQIVNELSSAENGIVMFASSTGRQVSIENDAWGNGAFTEALLEGFAGKADYVKDGKLTIAELDLFLSERVKELTDKRQHPVARKPDTVPDFPIALVAN
jgi:WD40 repeat protein